MISDQFFDIDNLLISGIYMFRLHYFEGGFSVIDVKMRINEVVREPNSENCLDLIFDAPFREKVIIVPDTNYITSAIRRFILEMPSPGSFQNIGFLI